MERKPDTKSKVQGEGGSESARKFNERSAAFVKDMKPGEKPDPVSREEARELTKAEEEGRARSRASDQR